MIHILKLNGVVREHARRTGANKSLSKFTRGFDKDIVAPYTARALASYTIDLMYKRLRT